MSTKIAFITGTTSGFGLAIANRLASLGHNIIITGRRRDRLEALTADVRSHYGVEVLPLCFDIRDREACRQVVDSLPERWQQIDFLINNAGLAAGSTPIQEGDMDDWERMIDTNVKGLLYISRFVIPLMVRRKTGHIINISSIAGVEVYPSGNVYCATKHAVNAITKGMRIDLLKENIKVSSIAPGAAETEFSLVRFHGDQEKADAVYKGLVPLNAEDIADTVEFIITRPPHVNINDILLTPTRQANTYLYHRES